MSRVSTLFTIFCIGIVTAGAQNPTLQQPLAGKASVDVKPALTSGYTLTLQAFDGCAAGATSLGSSKPVPTDAAAGTVVTVPLTASLASGDPVCAVQAFMPTGAQPAKPPTTSALMKTVLAAAAVTSSGQCNQHPDTDPYSDCDWNFSVIGGVEQAGLSSQASVTNGFLLAFTRTGPKFGNRSESFVPLWARIRLLSSPQTNSTQGVAAAFADPTGVLKPETFSNVGTSIDYSVGVEFHPWRHNGQYTASLIAGGGGTTPLTSNTVAQAFVTPVVGTVECNLLYQKFQKIFSRPDYNMTKNPGTSGPCLLNANAPIAATSSTATTFQPINTIAFSNTDRTNFLGKVFFGVRTIDRFRNKGAACGDAVEGDTSGTIAPCSRGVVDIVGGLDSSITGGQMRHWVFKVDAVHPLPINGNSILYLFGSFSIRFKENVNSDPLILKAGDVASLGGTGTGAAPNVNTVVLPLQQPDRDFYRFGVGLNVICIFKKLASSSAVCPS